jgi:hypothetical protein
MRLRSVVPILALALASRAGAQAPSAGPVILLVPASTRAIPLGNAWITGRDQDVVFYNPAQMIGARSDFAITAARYGGAGTLAQVAGVYSAGPASMTLGWGVQLLGFQPSLPNGDPHTSSYLYVPADLLAKGDNDAFSLLTAFGGAMVYKTVRIGLTAKYATDRIMGAGAGAGLRRDAFLGDVGIARNLLSGVAGLTLQNVSLGGVPSDRHVDTPKQYALGWSRSLSTDQFDFAFAGQVTARDKWIAPGGGIEMGYGWIEGYSVAVRAGARKPETNSEKPVAVGATINADHLTLEYALQFFDGGRTANRVTLRWR